MPRKSEHPRKRPRVRRNNAPKEQDPPLPQTSRSSRSERSNQRRERREGSGNTSKRTEASQGDGEGGSVNAPLPVSTGRSELGSVLSHPFGFTGFIVERSAEKQKRVRSFD